MLRFGKTPWRKLEIIDPSPSHCMSLSLILPGIFLYCLHEFNFTISESNYVRAAKARKQTMDSEMTPPFLPPKHIR